MNIINKSKEVITICMPENPDICIEIKPKQVIEFSDNEAKEILSANSSLAKAKEKKEKKGKKEK